MSGLSIDPRAAGARAAREKEAKAFQQRPNPVAQITMSSTVADAGGQASDVACLTLAQGREEARYNTPPPPPKCHARKAVGVLHICSSCLADCHA